MENFVEHKLSVQERLQCFLLAFLIVSIWFSLTYNVDINLADEGYLWYGVWRTAWGEVPMRDFQSYDPGRYYWCAFFNRMFGNGIIPLRSSIAIFQFMGLLFGLLVLRREHFYGCGLFCSSFN